MVKYSLNGADFDARARHANDPQQFDGGYGGGGGRGGAGLHAEDVRGRVPATKKEPAPEIHQPEEQEPERGRHPDRGEHRRGLILFQGAGDDRALRGVRGGECGGG